jgi:hypothetical protein
VGDVIPFRRAIVLNASQRFGKNRVLGKEDIQRHKLTGGFDEIHLVDRFPDIAPENTVLADEDGMLWVRKNGKWNPAYPVANF